jgi:hypothetical protein
MASKRQVESASDGEIVERCRRARRKLERRFKTPEEFFAWAEKLDARKVVKPKRMRKLHAERAR